VTFYQKSSGCKEAATPNSALRLSLVAFQGIRAVSDLPKKRGTIACPRCKALMEEVVRIDPVGHEPGLIGYECPSCCYVTSVLTTHPKGGEEHQAPDRRGVSRGRRGLE
jgi:transposase-like protein